LINDSNEERERPKAYRQGREDVYSKVPPHRASVIKILCLECRQPQKMVFFSHNLIYPWRANM